MASFDAVEYIAVSPATAKPAATVVLMRDKDGGGIEIYLVQRAGSMGFMGGMHVFPGGKVSAADASAAMCARIDDAHQSHAHAQWGDTIAAEDGLSRAVAAIRETFEEAGVLLAPNAGRAKLSEARRALLDGGDFVSLLAEAGLTLRLSLLVPHSRWITPDSEPVRFDTSFYLARAPSDQEAEHDHKESVAGGWLAPEQALLAADQKRIRLPPPTARTLEALLDVPCVDAALLRAAGRPPPTVQPILRVDGEQVVVLYPGDPEHPEQTRVLEGPTRRVWNRGER